MKWLFRTFGKQDEIDDEPVRARRRVDLGEATPEYAVYAIGDVHGCIDLLEAAEDLIRNDVERHGVAGLIILLGDYVDRGPNSAAVLDHLMSPAGDGVRRLPLCGNHDDLFLRFLNSPRANAGWLDMGGRETLTSYGLPGNHVFIEGNKNVDGLKTALQAHVPERHVTLLQNLPVCARVGQYVFAHAGLRPGVPLENQSDQDLMWIREPFIARGPELPFTLIHGHTPFREPSFGLNRIGIDTGAYVSGKLSVLKLYKGRTRILT